MWPPRSPRSAAPDWAVEGLAEWVSLRADRDGRSYDTDRFLARVRRSGAPRTPARRHRVRAPVAPSCGSRTPRPGCSAATSPIAIRPLSSASSTPPWTAATRSTRPVAPCSVARRPIWWPAGAAYLDPARRALMPTTLVVTNDFPPRIGGIESFVADVCRLLDHDVVVYTSGPPGAAATDHDRAPTPSSATASCCCPPRGVARRAAELLRSSRCDPGTLRRRRAARPARRRRCGGPGPRRVVGLTHGHEIWWAGVPGRRATLRRIGDGCDHLTTISDYTASRIAPAPQPARPRAAAPAAAAGGPRRTSSGRHRRPTRPALHRRRRGSSPRRASTTCSAPGGGGRRCGRRPGSARGR